MKPIRLLFSLPDDWSLVPIKVVCTYKVSNVDKHSVQDEKPVRLCNYKDVYHNDFVSPNLELMKATATEEEIKQFHLSVGDVVITKDSESWNDIAIPAYVDKTADDFICGYHLAIIHPNANRINGRFLFRCMQSRHVMLQLELEATGVTRFGIPKNAIGSTLIPLPSLALQNLIANYLDHETARIDALIAEKEKMLQLLEEKRSALINTAVTRGLNPNAKMKSSGLDWLGEIPAHWLVKRAKHLFSLRDLRSDFGTEDLLSVSHITGVTLRSEKKVNMFEADEKAGYKRCFENDLVTNTLWAWMGAMGISPREGIVSPDYHVYIIGDRLLPEFVGLLCRSRPFIAEVNRWSKGVWSSRLRLYPANFFEIMMPIPPLEEQKMIIAKMHEHDKKNIKLVEQLRKSITLAKERRIALITAAVTGQIPIEEMSV